MLGLTRLQQQLNNSHKQLIVQYYYCTTILTGIVLYLNAIIIFYGHAPLTLSFTYHVTVYYSTIVSQYFLLGRLLVICSCHLWQESCSFNSVHHITVHRMCGHNLIHILITSLTLGSLVSSELYHIVPTDSPSLCVNYTADSCMSLAQFAGRYVTSNDSSLTLVFSPGEHTLSQIIHISNIHNVTLIGDSEQLTVIDYVGDSGFELVNISSVLFVTGLSMSRNGQIVSILTVDNARSVLIENCHFVGRNDFQTPEISATVYVASAHNISISNSVF